jgi:lysophospholipase L1-like esterase
VPPALSIPTIIDTQVPRIDPTAAVVLIAAGAANVDGADPAQPLDVLFDRLVRAINARAPHARIVVVGVRSSAVAARLGAWNNHARRVAIANQGAFIDTMSRFPLTDVADFPDGVHPTPAAVAALVDAIVDALRAPIDAPLAKLAVIGGSMEAQIVGDDSPVPCGPVLRAPACDYLVDATNVWPEQLGTLLDARVLNLSQRGSQAADAVTSGMFPSSLDDSVPRIPNDTAIVLVEIGINDISIYGVGEPILSRIDRVFAAIRRNAPQARIVVVGLRDYAGSTPAYVTAWNDRERRAAAAMGATFVDIRSAFPASDHVDFPDGTHTSAAGAKKLAQYVAAAMQKTSSVTVRIRTVSEPVEPFVKDSPLR